MNTRNLVLCTLIAVAAGALPCGCESKQRSDGSSQSQLMGSRAPIANYRSQLDLIKPRYNETIDMANAMLSKAESDPKGAIKAFQTSLDRLRDDLVPIRAQVDELQQMGYDQYFLGADRTEATTADSKVISAREQYGFVGDYMVSLRNEAQITLGQLDEISSAVAKNPTAAGIRSVSKQIGNLAQQRIKLDSLIHQLTQAIDKMPRQK